MMATLAALALSALAAPLAGDAGGARIDHVILGVSSLEAGVREFSALSGVEASFGGEHPGAGTQNALASLGDGAYLEILAPVPGAEVTGPFAQIKELEKLAPIGWAVTVEDAETKAQELAALGYRTTGVLKGSRQRPDGTRLEWAVVAILDASGRPIPFFIDWADTSPHPSTTSPPGCQLAAFVAIDPDPVPFADELRRIGAAVAVEEGDAPGMKLTLRCPRGEAEFGVPARPSPKPPSRSGRTDMEANKDVVRRYVERFNAGDLEGLREVFADDAVVHGVLGWGKLDAVMPIWEQLMKGLAIQLHIDDMVAEGDVVAVRYTERGTSRAPFFDKPATGKSYELIAMEWFVVKDGKIERRWGARDAAFQAKQLGWDEPATRADQRNPRD